jgi:hypothetical protein
MVGALVGSALGWGAGYGVVGYKIHVGFVSCGAGATLADGVALVAVGGIQVGCR